MQHASSWSNEGSAQIMFGIRWKLCPRVCEGEIDFSPVSIDYLTDIWNFITKVTEFWSSPPISRVKGTASKIWTRQLKQSVKWASWDLHVCVSDQCVAEVGIFSPQIICISGLPRFSVCNEKYFTDKHRINTVVDAFLQAKTQSQWHEAFQLRLKKTSLWRSTWLGSDQSFEIISMRLNRFITTAIWYWNNKSVSFRLHQMMTLTVRINGWNSWTVVYTPDRKLY